MVVGIVLDPLELTFVLPGMSGFLMGSVFLSLGYNRIWRLARGSVWPELMMSYQLQLSVEAFFIICGLAPTLREGRGGPQMHTWTLCIVSC